LAQPAGICDAQKLTGQPRFEVTSFGAVGDAVADDTRSIQAAVDAAAAQGGGVVVFPPGQYKVSIDNSHAPELPETQRHAIGVQSGLILLGEADATIVLADRQGNFAGIFANINAKGQRIETSDVQFHRLRIDGNAVENPATQTDLLRRPRAAIRVSNGTSIKVWENSFENFDNANVVAISGKDVQRVCIVENEFSGIGGPTAHDHSSIYVDASSAFVGRNRMHAQDKPGDPSAVTAIETHGGDTEVAYNDVSSYRIGANITNMSLAHHRSSVGQVVHHNIISGAAVGINLWSYTYEWQEPFPFVVKVSDNVIQLDPGAWRTGADPYAHYITGIGIVRDRLPRLVAGDFAGLDIRGNHIVYQDQSTPVAYDADQFPSERYSAGIQIWHKTASMPGLQVVGNLVENPLASGIYLNARCKEARIANNRIVNPGRSANSSVPRLLRENIASFCR
jgi:hypothetical protein